MVLNIGENTRKIELCCIHGAKIKMGTSRSCDLLVHIYVISMRNDDDNDEAEKIFLKIGLTLKKFHAICC